MILLYKISKPGHHGVFIISLPPKPESTAAGGFRYVDYYTGLVVAY
jgi:hypothetical protein